MSTCWVNFSFSDDPGKRPKPSRTMWHLPRLKESGQIEKNKAVFCRAIFPWLLQLMSQKDKPSHPWRNNKLTWLKWRFSLSQNEKISLCLLFDYRLRQSAASFFSSLSPLSYTVLNLSPSLSLAASESERQQQTSQTRSATQAMITSCTQIPTAEPQPCICYLIRYVRDLMFEF